jgi:hypothetical protein
LLSFPYGGRLAHSFLSGLSAAIKEYSVLLSYPISASIKLNDENSEELASEAAADPRLKK